MVLLTHNTELNLSTRRCVPEHGAAHLRAFGFGADLRPSAESWAGANEPHLPVDGIAWKRMRKIVQAGVSCVHPAFCTVTASGSIRRPAAGSFFCFGLRRLRSRFPSATDPP
jgi:hypothetical protein